MADAPAQFAEIAEQLKNGLKPKAVSVRTLLSWFSAQRRGIYVVETVRRALKKVGLETTPDFESVWIDAPVEFVVRQNRAESSRGKVAEPAPLADPTVRIGVLDAANRTPVAVTPEASMREAVTLMLAHDFSQLPVIVGDRHAKGIISWRSLGRRLALGCQPKTVKDCTEPHHEVRYDAPLFSALEVIVRHDYALVRDGQNLIRGLITTSDLSVEFRELGEPYLLLAEIENHIRRLIYGRFTAEELDGARDEKDGDRKLTGIASLTLGEYLRLLEQPEHWNRLGLGLDRSVCVKALENVRRIRNEAMHFTPDGLTPEDRGALKDFVKMMQALRELDIP